MSQSLIILDCLPAHHHLVQQLTSFLFCFHFLYFYRPVSVQKSPHLTSTTAYKHLNPGRVILTSFQAFIGRDLGSMWGERSRGSPRTHGVRHLLP
ncbi:hypothetical protein CEXT_590851 [Caerostris extrusa]|uniref:Uncharacterized protein n=1 Tax=Caerostris extrusa TaxID=172846 RepID=A0AAV4URU5_CAEEX|nr:hypothetical protein CEXT_590851 [Caerostris extrusa]